MKKIMNFSKAPLIIKPIVEKIVVDFYEHAIPSHKNEIYWEFHLQSFTIEIKTIYIIYII